MNFSKLLGLCWLAAAAVSSALELGSPNSAKSQGCDWMAGFGTAGADDRILALAAYDDGSGPALYAGGEFTTIGGSSIGHIAKWDGNTWSPVGGGVNGDVAALAVFDDGSGPVLVAGGEFTVAGGVSTSYIAKWNGESWSPMGDGVNSWVLALTVFDDGSGPALFAGGRFSRPGTGSGKKVIKWDGVSWSILGFGLDGEIRALTGFHGENGPQIIAGGTFVTTAVDGNARKIAVWNGSNWAEFAGGFNGLVNALITVDEGDGSVVYAAGDFNVVDGVNHIFRMVKWDGQAWSALDQGVGSSPRALAAFDNGSGTALFVGGRFRNAGDLDTNYVAKWDGSSWSPLGIGLNGFVDSVAVLGRSLFVGGSFTSAGGHVSHRIAEYSCAAAPISADLSVTNSDGVAAVLPGGSLTYTIVAANAGPSSAAGVALTDDLPPSLGCSYTSAAAGGATGNTAAGSGSLHEILSMPANSSVTYTLTCSVSAAATGMVVNSASIAFDGLDPFPGNNFAADQTILTSLSLSLSKTADPEVYDALRDEIAYDFEIKNMGNTTLLGPATVADDREHVVCPAGNLVPGATMNCSATRSISQADLDSGGVTNVAVAQIGGVSSNAASATVTAVQEPRLRIAKELVDEPAHIEVGTVLSFVVTATNEGNISLSDVVVIDEIVTPDEARCSTLPPGATCSLSSSYVVGEVDVELGWLRNTAITGCRELPDFVTAQMTVEFQKIFADGFESGDTAAWAVTRP